MAKTNARGNDARETPIKRAAREIAAARSKARSAVANSATPQKRITRSSGLLSLAAGGVRGEQTKGHARGTKDGCSDEAEPSAEPDSEEDASDAATARKGSTGRPSQAASDGGVGSGPKAARENERSLGTKAASKLLARKSRARQGDQVASSGGDEAPAAKKGGATDDATSSDEGDGSDALTGELASRRIKAGGVRKKKGGGGGDKLRELERKLKKAEGSRR